VRVSVTFEVIREGCPTTWREIHGHYSNIDRRICPWESYIDEELRPYHPETALRFRLNRSLEIPDTTREFGGVSGGQTPSGNILPPIVFPKSPINTTSPADRKLAGSSPAPVSTGTDSSSDSWEEEDIPEEAPEDQKLQMLAMSDDHKLRKMRQAIAKGSGITVEIRGGYAFEGQMHEAVFSKEFKVSQPPAHVLEPYQLAYKQIEQIGASYQGGLPATCVWTELGVPREDIEVAVFKVGQGVFVRHGYRNACALDMINMREQIRAELPLGWSVSFGATLSPYDLELTQRMMNITSQLDATGSQYIRPWQVHLVKTPLRVGELGTPAARVCPVSGSWDDYRQVQTPPMSAKDIPTFVEATCLKESHALLRFGRDSNWPLKVTFATTASPTSTLAITYDVTWQGIESTEEGEISSDWCWNKFMEKVREENLTAPPAFVRQGVVWRATVRKENNSIRVTPKEDGIWTPEDPDGPPPMILFGPVAMLKVRSTLLGDAALSEMLQVLNVLYQGRYSVTEEVPTREWAIVGSFGDGVIPWQYRLELPQASPQAMISLNGAILEAALKTQNYDKVLDKYVRKFDPEEESSAVVAIESGRQGDHGWAVAFKQGPRRCLLLDTTDGISEEETL
jgi:hypothetical protein